MVQQAYSEDDWVDEDPPEAMPSVPPTQDELPCDDGEPMETQRHKWQMDILIDAMDRWLEGRGEGYVNGNMFVYFSLEQTRGKHFRGPDCFVVLGVPRGERKSWVVWEQGKAPDVVIELLSASTAAVDKGEKMRIYRDLMRVPEYYWFNPFDPDERAGFRLHDGVYEPIERDAQGRFVSPILGLTLVLWEGEYRRLSGTWLRWATVAGDLLPTDAEAAQALADEEQRKAAQEKQKADQERRKADQEKQRADQEKQRADQEKQRADQETRKAEQERQCAEAERVRAERAEQELARLQALLERRSGA